MVGMAPVVPSSTHIELALVLRELAQIGELLHDAALVARSLSAQTEWRARSASVFRERATTWAGEVTGLECLLETARLSASRAAQQAAERTAETGW